MKEVHYIIQLNTQGNAKQFKIVTSLRRPKVDEKNMGKRNGFEFVITELGLTVVDKKLIL